MVPVTVRLRKPRPHNEKIEWPILAISDWAVALLEHSPEFLLGGLRLEDVDGWKMLLGNFWQTYRSIDSAHPTYTVEGVDPCTTIPYALHGDEGSGLRKIPFLVESWQPIIGVKGPFHTNESGWLGRI